jgi:hypothetical protein
VEDRNVRALESLALGGLWALAVIVIGRALLGVYPVSKDSSFLLYFFITIFLPCALLAAGTAFFSKKYDLHGAWVLMGFLAVNAINFEHFLFKLWALFAIFKTQKAIIVYGDLVVSLVSFFVALFFFKRTEKKFIIPKSESAPR